MIMLRDGIAARVQPTDGDRDGETVLWIHGYTMDSRIWADLWRVLPDWSHLGIDLPGHGRSRAFKPKESLPELAHSLNDTAAVHGVQHIVSLSLGTLVALQMCIEAPEQYKTLTLAAPTFAGAPTDPASEERYQALMRLFFRGGTNEQLSQLWLADGTGIFKGISSKPEIWEALSDIIRGHAWSELHSASMYYLTRSEQSAASMVAIRSACLILSGEYDMKAFLQSAAILSQRLPDCAYHIILGAGHLCLLEATAQTCAALHAHWESPQQRA